jgi:hypothetical protein
MNTSSTSLTAVAGTVIGTSKTKLLRINLILILAGMVVAWIFYERWQHNQISIKLGILLFIVVVMQPFFLYRLLFSRTLVIGSDRLFLIRGREKVVGQIPYWNVAEVILVKRGALNAVGIHLRDQDDSDTFWPNKGWNSDCDVLLPDYLTASPESLAGQIAARAREARQGMPGLGYAPAGRRHQGRPGLRLVGAALVGGSIALGVAYARFNDAARRQGRGDVGGRPKQAAPGDSPSSKATAYADRPGSE